MNGFDALTAFEEWDGTAAGLVPRLEGLHQVLNAMLASFQGETGAQRTKRGASVLAPLFARARVEEALAEARQGVDPDPVAVAALVGAAGGALFWGLAIDARHGIELREKGHRPAETIRDAWIADRADALRAQGVKQPYRIVQHELAEHGVHLELDSVRKAARRGRKSRLDA